MTLSPDPSPAVAIARRHLALRTAVVVAGLLRLLDDALGRGLFDRDDVERRFPFLATAGEQLDALAGGGRHSGDPDHFRRLAADLAAQAEPPPPLVRVAAAVAPSDGILAGDLVAAAALVERDVRFGAVIAALQAPSSSHRPCIGLLSMLFDRDSDDVARLVATLAEAGFLTIEQPDEPRAEQSVRVPPLVLDVVAAAPPASLDLSAADDAPKLDDLELPGELLDRITHAAELMSRGELEALIVRGSQGTGRRSVLRAVAGRLERGLLVTGPDTAASGVPAGAIAVLTGAMLAWWVEPGLGQLTTVASPAGAGPIGVVTGFRGAVRVAGADRLAVIDLPTPDASARRRFWTSAGLPADEAVLDVVSHRYALSGGTIGRVAAQATAIARVGDRRLVTADDVRQAAQDQGRQRLESLAALLAPLPPALSPVLSGAAADAYEALVLRIRHREALAPAVGGAAGDQITRGVRALFSGPSGTGKTLSARALGARLNLDVYRADLAALVDKYIGETERRLDELFSRAEELDVVLLIDEGDALMTRRTDVRSSNDRYANLETDYLLQRLETYEGIVLITTNAPRLVDSAFLRRLDVAITFGPPGPVDRLQIWRQHLPQRHAVTAATLGSVATACRLTGGQIRNASINAALLALEAGGLVDDAALTAAVEREFTDAGQTSPLGGPVAAVSPFERAMAMP